MKGQSETIVFVLLFLIGITLFATAYVFSSGIFNQNLDVAKIESAENIMRSLDSKIQSVIGYGGSQSFDYALNEEILVFDANTLEIRFPVSIEVPRYWVNLTEAQRSQTFYHKN